MSCICHGLDLFNEVEQEELVRVCAEADTIIDAFLLFNTTHWILPKQISSGAFIKFWIPEYGAVEGEDKIMMERMVYQGSVEALVADAVEVRAKYKHRRKERNRRINKRNKKDVEWKREEQQAQEKSADRSSSRRRERSSSSHRRSRRSSSSRGRSRSRCAARVEAAEAEEKSAVSIRSSDSDVECMDDDRRMVAIQELRERHREERRLLQERHKNERDQLKNRVVRTGAVVLRTASMARRQQVRDIVK